ncbi:MAG: ribosome small subunit-dependent GTPase A [Saprospiraceae bacterium]|nr:ribosome small subunit-dependent GTPase A [Saprospiraceae bacterium]
MKGIVTKSTGSWYAVRTEDNTLYECRIVGKFRLKDFELTNPVAVGDMVEFEPEGSDNKGLIRKIHSRSNYIVRQSPRVKHHLHLIAANIDQAVIIVTIVQPSLKPGFIDRYLLMTEPHDIPVIIVFNKVDLYDEESMETLQYFRKVYESIGYRTCAVSALERTGIESLKKELIGKISLIGGQSGVGKSSLVNAMFPDFDLKTSQISDYSGKGVHTTTFAEMYHLDGGGSIIDTPGIKTLTFNNLTVMDVAHNFREMFALSVHCRFGGSCTHINEPQCAVRKAVEEGEISEIRYQNYITIIDELNSQNYWERKKNM